MVEGKLPIGFPDFYRRVGSTPNRWYAAGVRAATAATTLALVANNLRAIPFFVPKRIVLDRIAINVTTLVAGQARLGIYNDNGSVYPGTLVLDAGTVDTGTTGVKPLTIDLTLEQGLYWLVITSNAASTVRAIAVASLTAVLGLDSGLGTAWGVAYNVSFTYGALPGTFSGSAAVSTGIQPGIFVRLSA